MFTLQFVTHAERFHIYKKTVAAVNAIFVIKKSIFTDRYFKFNNSHTITKMPPHP